MGGAGAGAGPDRAGGGWADSEAAGAHCGRPGGTGAGVGYLRAGPGGGRPLVRALAGQQPGRGAGTAIQTFLSTMLNMVK